MAKCPLCAAEIAADIIKCRHCGGMVVRRDPVSGVYRAPGGQIYRQLDTPDGAVFMEVQTIQGYIDFTGEITGVKLPQTVIQKLAGVGIGPETLFLTRSSAHRALMSAGWTSRSGKRVGPSPFYPVQKVSRPDRS